MRIAIPYNEILPKGRAHDCFLFREAAELANRHCKVDLLIGKGSASQAALQDHYGIESPLTIHQLPIVRKNNPLNLSWNRPFFSKVARWVDRYQPETVLLSVIKQAAHLVKKRRPNTRYVYEAHELAAYPGLAPKKYFALEKTMLEAVDVVVVTTAQLKELLLAPPYSLETPIAVVPLAVESKPLPPPPKDLPPTVTYVGQLYKGQGIETLIKAMSHVPEVRLRIIGGKKEEISRLDPHLPNISFEGFIPPSQIEAQVVDSHAFIAPFELTGRMPYVAHTKLYTYGAWGRPVIAPDAPIVTDHLPDAWLYKDLSSLIEQLKRVGSKTEVPPILSTWNDRIARLLKILL